MAAPVAMLAYGLLGTSRQLVVSATTATSAMSAATVGPLAHGDAAQFAALSAALALVVAVVLVVGVASLALLIAGKRLVPRFPSTLAVLVLGIAVSALFDLHAHGVDVVGAIPDALPDPAIPHVSADDIVQLVAPALGVLVLTAEAVGVARALAVQHGYAVDPNRDLMAMGASNALAGLSSGFVQSGGASQTAAADGAGAAASSPRWWRPG